MGSGGKPYNYIDIANATLKRYLEERKSKQINRSFKKML